MTPPATAWGLAIGPALLLITGAAMVYSPPSGPAPASTDLAPLVAAGLAPLLANAVLPLLATGFDRVLLATAAMLTALGATTLLQVSMATGAAGEFYAGIVSRHGLFIAAGFLALLMGAATARYLDRLRNYPVTLLGAALALTAVTIVRGDVVNGARLWLSLGPVRFQPSEFGRLLLALFVAVYLYERRHLVASAWRVRSLDLPPAPYLAPLAAAVVGAAAVLSLQNDLGMAALVLLGATVVALGVGGSRPLAVTATAVLTVAAIGSYLTVPRVQDRVAGWLDPWADPAGRGFQLVQAEYALAAGSLAGNVASTPTGGVPEVHTDLILTAIGSHFGVLGSVAALSLTGLLVCRCVLAGLRTEDGFRSLVALSIAALLTIQIILIVGGTLRVLPLTGLTLPLLSYGGTSMVVTLFAIGIELGIGAQPAKR